MERLAASQPAGLQRAARGVASRSMGASTGQFRTLAMRMVGNVVVCVHGSLAPLQTEWNAILDLYRTHPNVSSLRTLVYTEGAAPSAAQRADLSSTLGKVKMPTAVMTSSTISRAAGTALSWLNPGFRVFSATDFEGAFTHLGASSAERRQLREAVDEMKNELLARSASGSARP
jgi:hypothetical protein